MFTEKTAYIWALLRIGLGAIFLWAFVDKLWGLGFATTPDKAWLAGGSPTTGFLKFGTSGPFAEFFQSMAGSPLVDWLFMLGLLGIGVGLILGVAVKLSCMFGGVMMVLMWLAVLPPEHHPVLDDHIIYTLVLTGICIGRAGRTWGFGERWSRAKLVKRFSWFE